MNDLSATILNHVCPSCQSAFQRNRSNQVYCSKPCAKAATRNAKRGSRKVTGNWDERRRNETRKGRVRGLSDALYEAPPVYRAEFMEKLIVEARGNSELRRLVTERSMLRSWDRNDGTGRLHIAHVLDHYCREVYGARSFEVLDPARPLPHPDSLAFPCEYYGPDAPPLYGDGSLTVRPCPWGEMKRNKVSSSKSPSTTIKEEPEGEPLRHLPAGPGHLQRDPSEFFEHLRELRKAHPLPPLLCPDALALKRIAYAEEIGMDQNVNAPL